MVKKFLRWIKIICVVMIVAFSINGSVSAEKPNATQKKMAKVYEKMNFEQVEQWARNGDIQAQIIMYYASKNKIQAEQWLKLIDNNEFLKHFALIKKNPKKIKPAKMYGYAAFHVQMGDYLQQNFEDMIRWAQLGASENDTLSYALLGTAYYTGRGVGQDYKLALQYFKMAEGEPIAIFHLSDAYSKGRGVEADQRRAKFFEDYYKILTQKPVNKKMAKKMLQLQRQMEKADDMKNLLNGIMK